ncbi:hypothetical protein E4U42_001741 [Claviceps africana]|uniref:Uncharacterized protein n=1 Tax=Claviceps africana TaxID=83212 RepID=A0A8K0IZ43_9HYPO|nr:hypothetical protein E4U42_001741 [Claviceps africana]
MPTYLCHGFRWYRSSIRPFIILNDLDECAPDWIIEPVTAAILLSQLAESFAFVPRPDEDEQHGGKKKPSPHAPPPRVRYDEDMSMPPSRVPPEQDRILMHDWSPVKLLEEYDENETVHAARPYAYMADYAVRVDLGADVLAEMARYDETLKQRNAAWFEQLRENVQPEEQSRWYVVVCDDTEREAPVEDEDRVEHEHKHEHDGDDDDDARTAMAKDPGESESGLANAPQRVMTGPGEPSTVAAGPLLYENKALPSIPAQEQNKQPPVPEEPACLHQDASESKRQPPGRLRGKMSLLRLFSKKEG